MTTTTMTQEQQKVVNEALKGHDLAMVQAFAGCGKTTTLRMLCENMKQKKILYVCFGRENQADAARKLKHLSHVTCSTFDSLGYQEFGLGKMPLSFTKWNIKSFFGYDDVNSAEKRLEALNAYFEGKGGLDKRGKAFVERLSKPKSEGGTEFTNFSYLRRKFKDKGAWNKDYELLMVDECQDLNPVMFECMMNFDGKKIFVGDEFQHIFSFMGTVDSFGELAERKAQTFSLSKSFRFGQELASFASDLLNKNLYTKISIKGCEKETKIDFYDNLITFNEFICTHPDQIAILAGKNSSLFMKALELMRTGKKVNMVGRGSFFERVKQEYEIFKTDGMNEVEKRKLRADLNEDFEGSSACYSVMTYGDEITNKLKLFEENSCEMSKAHLVFCTMHKSKGLEFETVVLIDDIVVGSKGKEKSAKEINDAMKEKTRLYYVGATRATKHLIFPNSAKPTEMKPIKMEEMDPLKRKILSCRGTEYF